MELRILDHRAPAAVGATAEPPKTAGRDAKVLIGLGAAIVVLIGVVVKAVVLTTASSDPDVT